MSRRTLTSMSPEATATAIRGLLLAVGAVSLGTGASVAVRGSSAIPGGGPTTASTDSVLRFYAVWWAAQGPAAWSLARDPMLDEGRVRVLAGTTFAGGLARIAAMRASGRPHPLFQALTVVELLAPPLLLAARRRVRLPGGR
ncbi:hypothetical protein DQ239_19810 [Blastococcus sp. TF02-09]|uniref:DUF4345 domain-containing protein n=1 Tax=Blastococcus sp. TF02-09 TaxID=2250576 RepID=UPI000DEBD67C|nr:DUF4345 domain-containing protein [Blastococcus sp. TF02-9]RBY74418.1 hypothetical protein DQ239_19810 [Blastococcus sp. TF02-9]